MENKIEERLKELKEKRKKELLSSLEMYKNTIESMKVRDEHDEVKLNLVMEAKKEVENNIAFLEQASDKELKAYFGFLSAQDFNEYNRNNQYYTKGEVENLLKYIKEPLRVNQYLVELPECFVTSDNEIVEFNWYNDCKELFLKVRESSGSHQLQNAYELLKTKNHTVIFKQLKSDLTLDYTIKFKKCQLISVLNSTNWTYSKDDVKCFTLIFKYKDLMFI